MDSDRIKEIQEETAYPQSISVYKALLKVWNECQQEHNEQLRLNDVLSHFNSDTFIDNVCFSYRHDFGLMAEQDRQRLRFECKEWMRAISNNWEYFKNGL